MPSELIRTGETSFMTVDIASSIVRVLADDLGLRVLEAMIQSSVPFR